MQLNRIAKRKQRKKRKERKRNNLITKWEEDLNRHFPRTYT